MDLGVPAHSLGSREKWGQAVVKLAAQGLGWPKTLRVHAHMAGCILRQPCLEDLGSLWHLTLTMTQVVHRRL